MKKTIIVMLILTLSVGACTKSSFSPAAEQQTNQESSSPPASPAGKINVNENWIEYWINTNYEANYAHWCQLWCSPLSSYEKRNACGPTAYMLAAHMVAAGNGYTFMPCTGSKLSAIVTHFGSVPLSISQIAPYVSSYDSPPLTTASYSGSDRGAFKSFLESHLSDGDPIIVPIFVSGSNRVDDTRYTSDTQSDNYDLDSSPQPGRNNYVLTTKTGGGCGHFVVVIGIAVYTPTGNGIVFYKDPLAASGSTRICSYSRFLESSKINGSCTEPYCTGYDAIVIKKH